MTFVHQSLTDRIYEHLKAAIVTHDLKPGERLEEQEIADSLRVSRTPVREALGRLDADGLVEILPRRGAVVVDLTAKDIKEVYEVREALEVLAVQLAVPRLTDDDLAGLERIHREFAEGIADGQYRVCFARDREFHDTLMQLCGNSKLKEFHDRLGMAVQMTRWMHCDNRALQEASYGEHSLILQALQRRDADQACARMCEHVRKVKADLLRHHSTNATQEGGM